MQREDDEGSHRNPFVFLLWTWVQITDTWKKWNKDMTSRCIETVFIISVLILFLSVSFNQTPELCSKELPVVTRADHSLPGNQHDWTLPADIAIIEWLTAHTLPRGRILTEKILDKIQNEQAQHDCRNGCTQEALTAQNSKWEIKAKHNCFLFVNRCYFKAFCAAFHHPVVISTMTLVDCIAEWILHCLSNTDKMRWHQNSGSSIVPLLS